jgi:hypothetical protein
MKKLFSRTFAILSLSLISNAAFSQIPNLVGTWEFMTFLPENTPKPCYTILRTFNEKGDYVQIAASPNGVYIEGKASFELSADGKVKEVITFAANPDRLGKTFNFTWKFMTNNGVQLLITEGGTKVVNGVETVEWREIWRRVEEYKK